MFSDEEEERKAALWAVARARWKMIGLCGLIATLFMVYTWGSADGQAYQRQKCATEVTSR